MANEIPNHIGIIMDGNGRWAKKRLLPRTAGHAVGAETYKKIARYCKKIGVKHLTVYAFSTENWSRSKEEVAAIMKLFKEYLEKALVELLDEGARLNVIGDMSVFDKSMLDLIDRASKINADSEYVYNIAVNYGGRAEIVNAARKIVESGAEISEEEFAKHLYTCGQPDPDLIIRTGGEKRLSNFLMWQSAYSELYFTDTLWPDFSEKDIDAALEEYAKRERRFGGAK